MNDLSLCQKDEKFLLGVTELKKSFLKCVFQVTEL